MKATWNDVVLAESDETILVEGVHYFPPAAVRHELLTPSATRTICPWKGEASYFSVRAGDQVLDDAAWTYAEPSPRAHHFKDYIAFWRGVQVA